ncbi:hypothetical protein QUF58_01955 [Anaerolineales bacterium HSG24]|nr:hypothetical protein [Anaerolineales bacterium HSG24]
MLETSSISPNLEANIPALREKIIEEMTSITDENELHSMTIVIKNSNDNTISLPKWLMELLTLHEGDLKPQMKNLATGQDSWLVNIFLELILTLFKPHTSENISTQKHKILEMERKQAEGYAKYPVQPDEFDIWEDEQVWGDEWHETR